MIIRNARVFEIDGTFSNRELRVEGEYLTHTFPGKEELILDAEDDYIIPGLVDIHSHGCMGSDVCDGTDEALDIIEEYELSHGITSLFPATMSFPEERLRKILSVIAERGEHSMIEGIYMEGPFLSQEKKGAQNPRFLQPPNTDLVRRLDQISGGKISFLTVAPELPGASAFIKELCTEYQISIAHSNANYETATEAFKGGIRQVTHLYNGMTPFSHQEPGILGAAAECPDCMAELICDMVHVHPSAVRMALRIFGEDRVIFISDSMRAAGMPDGCYSLGGQVVRVKGSHARLESGGLAGSVSNLFHCMRNAVKYVGIPLGTAVKCATVNPARAGKILEKVGSLEDGKYANFLILDQELNLKRVFWRGREIPCADIC